ncbi:unnamed protein product [Amoebophrya sp. A25]|nr:unnamed protein product [Amoebophrya sp. A25]|eukprot:GSA25T00019957001.1
MLFERELAELRGSIPDRFPHEILAVAPLVGLTKGMYRFVIVGLLAHFAIYVCLLATDVFAQSWKAVLAETQPELSTRRRRALGQARASAGSPATGHGTSGYSSLGTNTKRRVLYLSSGGPPGRSSALRSSKEGVSNADLLAVMLEAVPENQSPSFESAEEERSSIFGEEGTDTLSEAELFARLQDIINISILAEIVIFVGLFWKVKRSGREGLPWQWDRVAFVTGVLFRMSAAGDVLCLCHIFVARVAVVPLGMLLFTTVGICLLWQVVLLPLRSIFTFFMDADRFEADKPDRCLCSCAALTACAYRCCCISRRDGTRRGNISGTATSFAMLFLRSSERFVNALRRIAGARPPPGGNPLPARELDDVVTSASSGVDFVAFPNTITTTNTTSLQVDETGGVESTEDAASATRRSGTTPGREEREGSQQTLLAASDRSRDDRDRDEERPQAGAEDIQTAENINNAGGVEDNNVDASGGTTTSSAPLAVVDAENPVTGFLLATNNIAAARQVAFAHKAAHCAASMNLNLVYATLVRHFIPYAATEDLDFQITVTGFFRCLAHDLVAAVLKFFYLLDYDFANSFVLFSLVLNLCCMVCGTLYTISDRLHQHPELETFEDLDDA